MQPTRDLVPVPAPLRRRGAALVAALALVGGAGLSGCVVSRPTPPANTAPPGSTQPASPGSPSSTPPGTSTLSTKNLLTVEDIPLEDYDTQQAQIVKEGVGRPLAESSVCLPPAGLNELGASQELHRNFRLVTKGSRRDASDPFADLPILYTQALQFPDAAAAKAARSRYQQWLAACPKLLQAKGYELLADLGFDTTKIEVERGSATVTEIAYQRPGGADGDNGIWESVGLTVLGDRLMVTVFVHWGTDWEVSIDASEGDLLHPQIGLCDSASQRLAA